jgi:hypothetical protein
MECLEATELRFKQRIFSLGNFKQIFQDEFEPPSYQKIALQLRTGAPFSEC